MSLIPDVSIDLYRAVTTFAASTPEWVRSFVEVGTDAGLYVFGAFFLALFWQARDRAPKAVATALAVPFAVAGSYAVSEVLKLLIQEERPCRAVAGASLITHCPTFGDWSFPSNHATIAAASAAAVVCAWRRTALFLLPLAVLMAFSRVFLGVHYPHDVAAGFVLGSVLAPVLMLTAVRVGTPLLARWLQESSRTSPAS
ncbi:phosphatase PAP2 family protein [Crossiella equi]|uniref:phosphatase PAP2 family protein n=1 Tax=Crossiella equi TaxID=130796 RepID=UPI001AE9049A|nr:phosphatase PAP2 family protein [Crossiella equi]